MFQHSRNWESEDQRPVILFITDWHHPHVGLDTRLLSVFKRPKFSQRLDNYELKEGQPSGWFISAGMSKTVYEYAQELITQP